MLPTPFTLPRPLPPLALALALAGSAAAGGCADVGCPEGTVLDPVERMCLRALPDQSLPDQSPPDQSPPDQSPPDLGPCGTCGTDRPICDVATRTCVACTPATEAADCDGFGPTPVCGAAGDCVACRLNPDCPAPTASRCLNESCTSCLTDPDCTHLAGTPRCVSGACRACTPATEAADCAGNSCNPATNTCTATMLGSRGVCQSCVADTDCLQPMAGGTFRCVPMNYQGTPRGGYCLRAAPGCARPFLSSIFATSLSGAAESQYCGIDQTAVSCEAVLALRNSQPCPNGLDTECPPDGGLCRTVGVAPNQCTYACGSMNACPPASPGSTCGGDYCGSLVP